MEGYDTPMPPGQPTHYASGDFARHGNNFSQPEPVCSSKLSELCRQECRALF